jgi:hypothetical protein
VLQLISIFTYSFSVQGFFSELWRKQNGQVPQLMLLQQTLGGAPTPDRNPLTSATGGEMATLDADVLGLGDLGCGHAGRVSQGSDQWCGQYILLS